MVLTTQELMLEQLSRQIVHVFPPSFLSLGRHGKPEFALGILARQINPSLYRKDTTNLT